MSQEKDTHEVEYAIGNVDDEIVKTSMDITDGISEKKVSVQHVVKSLHEFQKVQEEISTILHDEQTLLNDHVLSELHEFEAILSKLSAYNQKANDMAVKMKNITDRVAKLKHRCGNLQLEAHKHSLLNDTNNAASPATPTPAHTTTTNSNISQTYSNPSHAENTDLP